MSAAETILSPPRPTDGLIYGGVLFRGPVYGGTGYADTNANIVGALSAAGVPVQVLPVGLQNDPGGLLPPERHELFERLQAKKVHLPSSLFFQSCAAGDFDTLLDARVRIGRSFFETDRLPDGWRERCQAMDQIWVATSFNLETFAAAGVERAKLRVMPEGLDTSFYRPGCEPLPIAGRRGFNFLSIFEWTDRKGPDVLLRAYVSEFRADEDVALILKIHKFDEPNASLIERLLDLLERRIGVRLEATPPILLVSGLLPLARMPRLYASADAYVLPSRGEGLGRPYLEAAACGLPVLATRWGGQLDSFHDENSFLIDIEGVVPVPRNCDRDGYLGHRWAEPSVDHLRTLMRQVYRERELARTRAERARREIAAGWDWSVLGPRWAEAVLEQLS